jgi:osmotically-inducible protein OsmY
MVSSEHNLLEIRDRDLERRVANYLFGYKMPALREIDIESDRGTVTLRGEVFSFHQKQLCINCCRRVAGVIRLVDEIQVVPSVVSRLTGI